MDKFKNKKDEEIIQDALKDSTFYAEIIFRYETKISRYISRISKIPKEDIEDITQDVFLSIYENLNSFNNDFSFSSWIYRIAHNKTINFWKKYAPEESTINLEDNIFIVEQSFNENSVIVDMELIENKELIEKVFQNMSKKYREVLILKFLENKNYREMSDILQKPMGSIATLINRAKKQFKQELIKWEKGFYSKNKKK